MSDRERPEPEREQPHGLQSWRLSLLVTVCTALSLVWAPDAAWGVIVSHGDEAASAVAPEDDPGWFNVGTHGGGTAVYLGNRWVITADHLRRVETITFDGEALAVETGSEIVLNNPADMDLSPFTDLRLVRLADDPRLPRLRISNSPPPVGSEVVLIGRGRDRLPELFGWQVTGSGDTRVWSETLERPFDYSGYKWTSSQTMRWGTNVVSDDVDFDSSEVDPDHNVIVNVGATDVITLLTRFDDQYAAEFESHASKGDSGGGVFLARDGQWELAGIMVDVSLVDAQPANAAVFGNFTMWADLSVYRGQIESLINSVSLQAGDANQDLSFDQLDMVQVVRAGKYLTGQAATWGQGDWNGAPGGRPGHPPAGDGVFNHRDLLAAISTGHYRTGRYAAGQPLDAVPDVRAAVIYDANTGEVALDVPAGIELSAINLDSATGIFTESPAQNLSGIFDNHSDHNVFKATLGASFSSLSFGPIAEPGLTEQFIRDDVTAVVSPAGGGPLVAIDLVYVPEPSSLQLVAVALVGVFVSVGRSLQCRPVAPRPAPASAPTEKPRLHLTIAEECDTSQPASSRSPGCSKSG